ncbi:MAG: HAD hydrolase-like protein [Bacteroidales bacterium]|nr:HAD hydrolase-like protein [Bacteroidales bacterium]
MSSKIKVIGFDADDTLWENEPYYRETEDKFCDLLKDYLPKNRVEEELFKTEINNLELYGYGIKAFTLSLIETAIRVSDSKVPTTTIKTIIELGKEQLNRPNLLLDGVNHVLETLKPKYKLIVATKGDLLDQERKLNNSNLLQYFHHIEIMSDKKEGNYKDLLKHLDIEPDEFLMVGNSLKSDILPILNLGGYGVFIPFHVTWLHERVDESEVSNPRFYKVNSLHELLKLELLGS